MLCVPAAWDAVLGWLGLANFPALVPEPLPIICSFEHTQLSTVPCSRPIHTVHPANFPFRTMPSPGMLLPPPLPSAPMVGHCTSRLPCVLCSLGTQPPGSDYYLRHLYSQAKLKVQSNACMFMSLSCLYKNQCSFTLLKYKSHIDKGTDELPTAA